MTKQYFVTGTDTGVGKTIACIALLQAARSKGWITAGYKPVACGCEMTSSGLRNSDALALQKNSSVTLSYTSVNPYIFSEQTSPHIASINERCPIEFSKLTQGLRELKVFAKWILVEGAGGWLTLLTPIQSFSEWVKEEKLPVILVVGVKVGCINHTLLTAEVITNDRLCLAGWIANDLGIPRKWHTEYLSTLKHRLNAPFLGEIPWLERPMEETKIWKYLDISVLDSSSSGVGG